MFRRLYFLLLVFSCALVAQDLKPIQLPKPRTQGGKPLMQVLQARKSTREFSSEKLSLQTRPDGRRTAPSAMNHQETDIYVVVAEGVYIYDAKENSLKPVIAGDQRAAAGDQNFVRTAPLNLVYVADFARMGSSPEQEKVFYSAADAGFIAQNVYLYCASEGLGAVVRGGINRDNFAKVARLRPEQKVLLAQSVGYPR
jgi:SagB-type dehydrogenase family enzyme